MDGSLLPEGKWKSMYAHCKSQCLQQDLPPQQKKPDFSSCSESDLFMHRKMGMLGIIYIQSESLKEDFKVVFAVLLKFSLDDRAREGGKIMKVQNAPERL